MLTVAPGLVIADDPYTTDLIAAQHYDAGNITIWNDADTIFVKIETDDGWEMRNTHVHVADSLSGFPKNGKNPPPGQFDYQESHDPPVSEYTYELENDWDSGDDVLITVHADVCKIIDELHYVEEQLPDQVTVLATHSYPIFDQGYFKIEISNGDNLNGNYDGWCIDTDHNIHEEQYLANVYSSYETIDPPLEFLEYPENLDLVNYILNQQYIGKPSGCDGVYTFGDVQIAIWTLVDDNVPLWPISLGPYEQCRIDEILADANANGEGYEPGCNDILAIILEPTEIVGIIGQIAIIEVPIPCYEDECETAWIDGLDFPGNNWAMYVEYTLSGNIY